jgi:peptide chain release factor 1
LNGHVVVKLIGKKVWELFKSEAGKHCVQRVPPTEKNGRKQTSYLSVGVLPLPPGETLLPESEVSAESDVKTQRGSGPGGQHRNTCDSTVRMVHKPTGLSVTIDGRSQSGNKREALKILTARVRQHYDGERNADFLENRKAQMGDGGRGDKIRTYNFINSRAVDHRTGKKTAQVRRIIEKGEFDLIK